jgi:hypothetical protein
MEKPRRHKKLANNKLTDKLHLKDVVDKDAAILKPGIKVKLAWRVTYKKK